MLSCPRFDLSESSMALLLLDRRTPAWREVYTRTVDELVRRHATHWAAVAHTQLTDVGVAELRKRLPNGVHSWRDPAPPPLRLLLLNEGTPHTRVTPVPVEPPAALRIEPPASKR